MTVAMQGATGVPEERWPTKTSSGTRANVLAKLVTCCSRCGLLSFWFMYVVLLLTATRVSCFTFRVASGIRVSTHFNKCFTYRTQGERPCRLGRVHL